MLLDVAHPGADVLERLFIRDVIHEQDPHGTTVVRLCDSAESLLPSGVPDLQLDFLAVEFDCPDLEVDTDRGNELVVENILRVTAQQTTLSDTTVSNQK